MDLRKIGSSAIIIFVVCCSFLFPYLSVPQVSYAEDESLFELEGDALVAAMQAYANARGGGFTTAQKTAFLTFIRQDQTYLRQLVGHIKADRNSPVLQFIYDNTSISLLNNWFNSFMSQYDLPSQSEYAENPSFDTSASVKSGNLFTDDDGNTCITYDLNINPSSANVQSSQSLAVSNLLASGSWLKYSLSTLQDGLNCNWNIGGRNYTLPVYHSTGNGVTSIIVKPTNYTGAIEYDFWSRSQNVAIDAFNIDVNGTNIVRGALSIVRFNNGVLGVGSIGIRSDSQFLQDAYRNKIVYYVYKLPTNLTTNPYNIDIQVPSGYDDPLEAPSAPYYITPKKPNGDVYNITTNEGDDYTTNYNTEINNYIDNSITNITYPIVQTTPYVPDAPTPDDPDPDTPTPDDPVVPENPDYSDYLQAYLDYYQAWNDIIVHIDNDLHSIKSKLDSVINYLRAILLAIISPQAFDPSDLPDMDFSLPVNLEDKFPFCIPFDILMFASVLKADPEAPSFQGDIDFTIYTWHAEFDLTDFDDLAAKIRLVEYLGFLVGLMVFTAYLFKG